MRAAGGPMITIPIWYAWYAVIGLSLGVVVMLWKITAASYPRIETRSALQDAISLVLYCGFLALWIYWMRA